MDPATIDALTFDCYGTIIDWERGLLDALAGWRRRTSVTEGDEELLARFGTLETAVQAERPSNPYPEILAEVLKRLASALGADTTDEERVAFGESVGLWPPFPDSGPALRSLGQRFRLVVVSNVDRPSFLRSQAAVGVEFDALVAAGEVGAYKPDHHMFEAALSRLEELGVDSAHTVHVAQSLYHDHVPAKAFGLRTVWVDRRRGRGGGATPSPRVDVRPDLTVSSLAELAEYLAPSTGA